MDLDGKFPIRNVDGNPAIFILYDWTSNDILVTPIKDSEYYTMVESFTKNVEYLLARGFKPEYNIMEMWHKKQFGITSLKRKYNSNL